MVVHVLPTGSSRRTITLSKVRPIADLCALHPVFCYVTAAVAAAGGFAVVAVMLQPPSSSAAQPNPCLAAALAHVPDTPQAEAACPSSVNPQQLLPAGAAAARFVHYAGSLTTPPCSEQVDWLVWEQPLPVTDKQVHGDGQETTRRICVLVKCHCIDAPQQISGLCSNV